MALSFNDFKKRLSNKTQSNLSFSAFKERARSTFGQVDVEEEIERRILTPVQTELERIATTEGPAEGFINDLMEKLPERVREGVRTALPILRAPKIARKVPKTVFEGFLGTPESREEFRETTLEERFKLPSTREEALSDEGIRQASILGLNFVGAAPQATRPVPLAGLSDDILEVSRKNLKKYGFEKFDDPQHMKAKFRETVKKLHPDQGGNPQEFKQFMDDFENLTSVEVPAGQGADDLVEWIRGVWRRVRPRQRGVREGSELTRVADDITQPPLSDALQGKIPQGTSVVDQVGGGTFQIGVKRGDDVLANVETIGIPDKNGLLELRGIRAENELRGQGIGEDLLEETVLRARQQDKDVVGIISEAPRSDFELATRGKRSESAEKFWQRIMKDPNSKFDVQKQGETYIARLKSVAQGGSKQPPLSDVWYHGTGKQFDKFDESFLGGQKGSDFGGFWFTKNPEEADAVAKIWGREKGRVVKTKLDIDPHIVDLKGGRIGQNIKEKAVKEAKKQGKNAVVFKNLNIVGDEVTDHALVFDPKQIKQGGLDEVTPIQQEAIDQQLDLVKGAIDSGDETAARELYKVIPENQRPEFEAIVKEVEEVQENFLQQAKDEVKDLNLSNPDEKMFTKMRNFLRIAGESTSKKTGQLFREHIPESVFGQSSDELASSMGITENKLMEKLTEGIEVGGKTAAPKTTEQVRSLQKKARDVYASLDPEFYTVVRDALDRAIAVSARPTTETLNKIEQRRIDAIKRMGKEQYNEWSKALKEQEKLRTSKQLVTDIGRRMQTETTGAFKENRELYQDLRRAADLSPHVSADAKRVLGIDKDIRKMTLGELDAMVNEMRERLAFKESRGYVPKTEVVDKSAKAPEFEDDFYEVNAKLRTNDKPPRFEKVGKDAKKLMDELGGSISTRLANINPILKDKLLKYEFDLKQVIKKDSEKVDGMFDGFVKIRKENKDDFWTLDLALKNGDKKKISQIVEKYGLQKEYEKTRKVLDNLWDRADEVGFDIGYQKNYWPRTIKDPDGFMEYLRGQEGWSLIDQAIKEKEMKLGRALKVEERANLANNMIRGYRGGQITLSKIGAMKGRTMDIIDPELNRFYETSDKTLQFYIRKMNDVIESRKFFGKQKALEGADKESKNNIHDSVGTFVNDLITKGEISPKQELELRSILEARFNVGKTGPLISLYKNLAYIDTLGNVVNAVTQLGDSMFSVYESGWRIGLSQALKSALGKSKITKEDMGFASRDISAEIERGNLSGLVDNIMQKTGFNKMDRIGSESVGNAAVVRLQQEIKEGSPTVRKEIEAVFPEELWGKGTVDKVIKDLERDFVSDEVKFIAFYKNLQYTPRALSEMPEQYLRSGNSRVFYVLKTWTIKLFDIYRREIYQVMKKDKKQGIKNMLELATLFLVFNATADTIKDVITGKKIDPSDTVIDNMLKIVGFSRYHTREASRQGIASTLGSEIVPPAPAIDNISKDVRDLFTDFEESAKINELRTIREIPVGGDLYYWWFGRGVDIREKYYSGETDDFDDFVDSLDTGGDEDEFDSFMEGLEGGGSEDDEFDSFIDNLQGGIREGGQRLAQGQQNLLSSVNGLLGNIVSEASAAEAEELPIAVERQGDWVVIEYNNGRVRAEHIDSDLGLLETVGQVFDEAGRKINAKEFGISELLGYEPKEERIEDEIARVQSIIEGAGKGETQETETEKTPTRDEVLKVGDLEVRTEENRGFPFPDYESSVPGERLRADIQFEGQGEADIIMHFKDAEGNEISVPQTKENFEGGTNFYGLEINIPEDAATGTGEVWVTVNGEEAFKVDHEITEGEPIGRYEESVKLADFRNPDIEQLAEERQDIISTIKSAAQEHGVPESLMVDIAFSESSLDPNEQSSESTAGGLFQFIDSSWKQMMRELGLPEDTPKTDPEANAKATALAISKGRLHWWDASKWNWGRFYEDDELNDFYQ